MIKIKVGKIKLRGKPLMCTFFLYFFCFSVNAQVNDENSFSTEFTFGITINTNSGLPGGIILKYAKNISPRWSHLFFIEIVNVKNPKENRVSSGYSQGYSTSTYIQNKINNLYVVRPQYGREFLLFRKAPDQGVRIDAIIAGGLSLGLLKPYYVEYDFAGNGSDIRTIKYLDVLTPGSSSSTNNIVGSSGFQGFGELELKMGLNAKLGLSFEFGAFKNTVTGFDIGFLVEGYNKDMPIIYSAPNRSVFTSAYLTLFFGSRK